MGRSQPAASSQASLTTSLKAAQTSLGHLEAVPRIDDAEQVFRRVPGDPHLSRVVLIHQAPGRGFDGVLANLEHGGRPQRRVPEHEHRRRRQLEPVLSGSGGVVVAAEELEAPPADRGLHAVEGHGHRMSASDPPHRIAVAGFEFVAHARPPFLDAVPVRPALIMPG